MKLFSCSSSWMGRLAWCMWGWHAAVAAAAVGCERVPFHPEVPAGLAGGYDIIGKAPGTGASYSGRLVIEHKKDGYAMARTVNGKTVRGDAWLEVCGPDKIHYFWARYGTRPATELLCRLGNDGDNYHRATCRARRGKADNGLEAWFQIP